MNPSLLNEIIDGLSPNRLCEVIRRLLLDRPAASRDHVEVADVVNVLLGDMTLPQGAEGWRAQLALKRAIAHVAAQTDSLRYVEGDS